MSFSKRQGTGGGGDLPGNWERGGRDRVREGARERERENSEWVSSEIRFGSPVPAHAQFP